MFVDISFKTCWSPCKGQLSVKIKTCSWLVGGMVYVVYSRYGSISGYFYHNLSSLQTSAHTLRFNVPWSWICVCIDVCYAHMTCLLPSSPQGSDSTRTWALSCLVWYMSICLIWSAHLSGLSGHIRVLISPQIFSRILVCPGDFQRAYRLQLVHKKLWYVSLYSFLSPFADVFKDINIWVICFILLLGRVCEVILIMCHAPLFTTCPLM